MNKVTKIDDEGAERIAFASTEPSLHSSPARWTELAVYYLHKPKSPSRRWKAVVCGLSTMPGERMRKEEVTVGTLERALAMFDTSKTIGRSVTAQAMDWRDRHVLNRKTIGFDGDDQDEALRWLYGDELDEASPASLLERDFGVGESTVRMALKDGRPIRIPLVPLLRFFDREAFQRERQGSNG